MKISRIIKIFTCVFLSGILFSGCAGNENLKDLSVVEGMGIDRNEDSVTVTVQSLNLSKEGSGAEALSGNITMNEQGGGANISDAVQTAGQGMSKKLFFGQNKLLVLGWDYAGNDLQDCFDYLIRNPDSRPDVAVCISSSTANEALSSSIGGALVPSQAITELLYNGEHDGFAAYVTVNEMLNLYKDKTSDIYLPVVTASENSAVVSGIAVFNSTHLAAVLPQEQILGFLLLSDKSEQCYFEFESDSFGSAGAKLSDITTKARTRYADQTVVYSVEINATLSVEELEGGDLGSLTQQDLQNVAKQAQEELEGRCRSVFAACVQNKSDCLRIGERLAADCPSVYSSLSTDWAEQLGKIRFEINCSLKLEKVNENANRY